MDYTHTKIFNHFWVLLCNYSSCIWRSQACAKYPLMSPRRSPFTKNVNHLAAVTLQTPSSPGGPTTCAAAAVKGWTISLSKCLQTPVIIWFLEMEHYGKINASFCCSHKHQCRKLMQTRGYLKESIQCHHNKPAFYKEVTCLLLFIGPPLSF